MRETPAFIPQSIEIQEQEAELMKQCIRTCNDVFRATLLGGTVILTEGIQKLGTSMVSDLVSKVRHFNDFNESHDPYGEHDFGVVSYEDPDSFETETVFWKIDYYDLNKEFHSPDSSDPKVTHRVITIMLASEY